MPHDVRIAQRDLSTTLDVTHASHCIRKAIACIGGQINLRRITRRDDLRVLAHAREEHFHLRDGRVLSLVQNDERIVERSSAHIGEWYYLNDIFLHVSLELVVLHHFV